MVSPDILFGHYYVVFTFLMEFSMWPFLWIAKVEFLMIFFFFFRFSCLDSRRLQGSGPYSCMVKNLILKELGFGEKFVMPPPCCQQEPCVARLVSKRRSHFKEATKKWPLKLCIVKNFIKKRSDGARNPLQHCRAADREHHEAGAYKDRIQGIFSSFFLIQPSCFFTATIFLFLG